MASGSLILGHSLFITGKRIAPNPSADAFQSNLPNLRYFISALSLFYRFRSFSTD
jgi:hypothetical protein